MPKVTVRFLYREDRVSAGDRLALTRLLPRIVAEGLASTEPGSALGTMDIDVIKATQIEYGYDVQIVVQAKDYPFRRARQGQITDYFAHKLRTYLSKRDGPRLKSSIELDLGRYRVDIT